METGRVSIDSQILTDIADSIRSKNGETSHYYPQNMAGKIDNILVPSGTLPINSNGTYDVTQYASAEVNTPGITPTGTINITSNGTVDVTNYASANVNVTPDYSTMYTSTLNAGTSDRPGIIETIKSIPVTLTVSGTLEFAFMRCTNLTVSPSLIIDGDTYTASRCFWKCTNLNTLTAFDTSSIQVLSAFCRECTNLVNVPVLDFTAVKYVDNMFQNCPNLSDDSLNNIMASLLTATSYTGTKTLSYIGLDSTQTAKCTTLSNWSALSSAGWTT